MAYVNGFHGNSQMDEDFEEIRIEVPWGHIAGKWWGPKDVQPILAMHGWQDNAGTFDRLAPLLKGPDVSILCVDLPGHGFSSHYPKGQYYYLLWDGVIWVRRIVKHFNWAKVSILGHSLGGAIGFLYAAVYPDEVEKYISLDVPGPVVRDTPSKFGDVIDRFLKYETLTAEQNPSCEYNDMLSIVEDAHKDNLTRKSCEIMMRRGMQSSEKCDSIYGFCRDVRLKVAALGMFGREQVYEFATRITCQVLNIRAKNCTLFNDEYYNGVMDKIRTNASVLEYQHVLGTHHVHLNNPERVSGIIKLFLKS